MLNPFRDGKNPDPTPVQGSTATFGDTTHKYLIGGYGYVSDLYYEETAGKNPLVTTVPSGGNGTDYDAGSSIDNYLAIILTRDSTGALTRSVDNTVEVVSAPFSYQITGTNTLTGYAAMVTNGNQPAWLQFDPVNGLLSGTPDTAGTTTINLDQLCAANRGQHQERCAPVHGNHHRSIRARERHEARVFTVTLFMSFK